MNNQYFHGMLPGNHPNFRFQGGNDFRDVQNACQKYMNYHVIGQMADGTQVEGIIEDMDDEGVTMLVPEIVEEDTDDDRIYGGYGGYGGRRRFRRFRRRRFPFFSFVFPFIFPYPYYY